MKKYQIVYKKVSDLKLNLNNPRINDNAVDMVAKSIEKYGFKNPLIIDSNNVVYCGNTRLKASIKLGLKEVPCIIADDLSKKEIRGYAILDNKTNEIAQWNYKLLEAELKDLSLEDFDLEWNIPQIEEDKEIIEDEYDIDGAVEKVKEPRVKQGEIWQLGNHRIMCGDSTNEEDVKKLIKDNMAKCIFTSPPYNMNADMYKNYSDNLKSKEYIDFNLSVINIWVKYLSGYLFWNISYNRNARWEFIEILYKIIKETNLKFMELIVWNKGHALPITSQSMLTRQYEDILLAGTDTAIYEEMDLYCLGTTESKCYFNKKKGKGITNYWSIDTNRTQLKNHKACFPVGLPARGIELTTNEKDIVLDCFGGSGSTLIACEQLDRICYMMELDPIYASVIVDRWEHFTGKKAIKLEGILNVR